MSRKTPEEFGVKRKKINILPLIVLVAILFVAVFYLLSRPNVTIEENTTLKGVIYIKSSDHYALFNEFHEVKAYTSVVIPLKDICYGIKDEFTLLTDNVKKINSMVCWKSSQRNVFFKYRKKIKADFVNVTKETFGLRVDVINPSDYTMEITFIVRDFGKDKSEMIVDGKKVAEFVKDYQYKLLLRPGESLTLDLRQIS